MSTRRALVSAFSLTAIVLVAVVAIGARHGALGLGPDTAGSSATVAPAAPDSAAPAETVSLAAEGRGRHDDDDDDDDRPRTRPQQGERGTVRDGRRGDHRDDD